MTIQLLRNVANTKGFRRDFVANVDLEGTLKEGSDVLHPQVLVNKSNPVKYNMMYIPDFGRYYFITHENIRNELWLIKAIEPDVLFTYKDAILKQTAIIDKQENLYSNYINDGSYVSQVNTYPEVIKFNNGFNDNGQFILITAGGR